MNSSSKREDSSNPPHGPFDTATLRIVAMLLVFASAAVFEANQLSSLSLFERDDIWWHLRTGTLILQNGLSQSGLFSQSQEIPGTASSWGYDLLVAFAFREFDLRAFPILLMAFKSALAVVTFLLAGGLRGRFWLAAVLSATVQYILGGVPVGSGYCSMLFFGIELLLLNHSRGTGSVRPLFCLPALFLVWANLDIQVVYGILLLVLFLITSLLRDHGRRSAVVVSLRQKSPQKRWTAMTPATAGTVAALCAIATLVTPYSYHLYGVFFADVTSAANLYFRDSLALNFRQPQYSLFLLLNMGAFLVLGLRRSRDPFQIALLAACAMLSFHAKRDAWLAALAALAVIAPETRTADAIADADQQRALHRQVLIAGGLSVAVLLLAAALRIPSSPESLLAKAARTYPVAACNYIRDHQLPPPLYAPYEWGGFLTWYLPDSSLAIGGRANLPYTSYPGMSQVGTLLLPRNSLMADALSAQTGFRVAYSDTLAVVLVKP